MRAAIFNRGNLYPRRRFQLTSTPLLEPLIGHGLWLVAEFAEMSFDNGGTDFVFGGQVFDGCFGIQKVPLVFGEQRDLLATSNPLPFDAEFLQRPLHRGVSRFVFPNQSQNCPANDSSGRLKMLFVNGLR